MVHTMLGLARLHSKASSQFIGRVVLVWTIAASATGVATIDASAEPGSSASILGMADPAWGSATYFSSQAVTHPSEIAATGANWIAVGPELLMENATSSVIYTDPNRTASDSSLANIVNAAHGRGLKVMMRPFVDSLNSGRTVIDPASRGVWFGWLRYWLNHYASLAQSLNVELFTIGTNFEKLSNDYRYLQVAAQVRERFSGDITYDATIYEYPRVIFWDKVDYIGIDAYWGLNPVDPHDSAEITSLWGPITNSLQSFSSRFGRKILFTEAGYRSVRDAVYNPVDWQTQASADQLAQSAAYKALFDANRGKAYFAGVFFWQWDVAGKLDQRTDYTPHGKLAESTLRAYSP